MARRISMITLALVAAAGFADSAGAQEEHFAPALEARIWLDRGDEPVLQRGDRLRVYYRTTLDSHVAIVHIDTDGRVRVLHPNGPDAQTFVEGEQDFRLLFARGSQWTVEEDPGLGYFFVIASPDPLDLRSLEYRRERDAWVLGSVPEAVYEDPYVAIDDYVAALVPGWESTPYALDFIAYQVGETHSYPRFLCYDCHRQRSYAQWNPYDYACDVYRVVLYDDPYYVPAFRYAGMRLVYRVPLRERPRYGVTLRASGEGWSPVRIVREAPPRQRVAFKEPNAARAAPPREAARRNATPAPRPTPTRSAVPRSVGPGAGTARPARPGIATGPLVRPAPRRSASATPPVPSVTRTTPGTRAATPRATAERPTLQRRPGDAGGSTAATRRPTRPSAVPRAARPGGRSATPARPSATPSRPRLTPQRPTATPSRPRLTPQRPTATPSRPSSGARSALPRTRTTPPSARPTPPKRATAKPAPSRPPNKPRAKPTVRRRGGGT